MHFIRRSIAALELVLIFPASLFMLALFMRNVQPPQYEPAQTARHIVDWFAARPHIGLHIFLMALPFAAFIIGCTFVVSLWRTDLQLRQAALQTFGAVRTNFAPIVIAAATAVAAAILAIVALHALTD